MAMLLYILWSIVQYMNELIPRMGKLPASPTPSGFGLALLPLEAGSSPQAVASHTYTTLFSDSVVHFSRSES